MLYTIKETREALLSGKTTSVQLVKEARDTFEKDKSASIPLNAFIEMFDDAVVKAEEADKEIAEAKSAGNAEKLFDEKPLLGIPFAIKDNMNSKGHRLTCASKILEGYVAPYNATVIDRLEKAGAIPLGRCNQDEFAMGSSTEYSCYGPTRNPINRDFVSGGSVRLPASYCGIYGLKPTYGVLSRWGIVAYGSSLDQVGILGHTPADIAEPLSIMCGQDMYDDTSVDLPNGKALKNLSALSDAEFAAIKVAIPKQFLKTEGADPDVVKCFEETRKWFESKGAKIDEVDLPILDASIASYYVIALSEAASNLSRFDGIRYGNRVDNQKGYDELYVDTRSNGFGPEVKRRIVIGNYVLSEQFSGDTYKKGMTVRARIQKEVAAVFEKYDIILCPTCPTASFKLGSKVDDPLEMYLSDLYTTFVNLARIPSINVPAGKTSKDGMPIGMQFAGKMFSEEKLLRLAANFEADHPGCGIPVK